VPFAPFGQEMDQAYSTAHSTQDIYTCLCM